MKTAEEWVEEAMACFPTQEERAAFLEGAEAGVEETRGVMLKLLQQKAADPEDAWPEREPRA